MFESAVRAVTRRFAKELWQVTSPLPRAVHPLPVSGSVVHRNSLMQVAAASVPAEDPKRRVLKDVFGFDDFRPGQDTVTEALLAGRHVLAVMPTGAGKSLCYQVPALVLGGLTIVVSPLVALMQDQVAALRLAGVAADTINSSLDRDANVAAWRRVAAGQTRLLYLAPERLMTARMLEPRWPGSTSG